MPRDTWENIRTGILIAVTLAITSLTGMAVGYKMFSPAAAVETLCPNSGDCTDCAKTCDGCKGSCKDKVKPDCQKKASSFPTEKQDLPLKISGVESIEAGNLVRLSVDGGTYPMLRWRCVPPSPNFEIVEAGKRAMFCSPVAGTWTFVLSASDGKELSDAVHTLTVIAGPPGPGPGPGPGPPVPPTPPVVSLKTLCRVWIAKVDSPDKHGECQRLASGFEAVAAQIAAGALKEPQAIIDATASYNRTALGLTSIPRWMPVLESLRGELNKREKAGPLDYASLWREIVEALREVQPAVPVPQPVKAAAPLKVKPAVHVREVRA